MKQKRKAIRQTEWIGLDWMKEFRRIWVAPMARIDLKAIPRKRHWTVTPMGVARPLIRS
jgi:hypothetical protein